MVITDAICSDADLQIRLGPDVLTRACKDITHRDALRQVALDDTVRAYGERLTNPIPEASLTPAILKRPVTARACSIILLRAFENGDDAWEKRRQIFEAEWESIVAGQTATSSSGGGSTPTTVVRAEAISVKVLRR